MVRRLIALAFVAAPVLANDMTVDRHTIRVGETVTITVSLEDAFASIDDLDIPVKHLDIGPTPSVSSQFSWINGTIVRRKIFRYVARADEAGPALVGPLVINLPDGERESFPAIAVQVLPDEAAGSNDPALVLRELLATGRDPFFVVAEIDRKQALVGEQVVVTWWLYNGASIQEWQISNVPKLAEFWVEEVDVRSAQPAMTYLDGYALQRMPVRRVALYPLQSGTLQIGSMELDAAVMRRTSSGPFGMFEGNVVDVSYSSAPLTLDVRPLPAAAAGALVGDVTLNCSQPRQRNGGPVVIDVSLRGRGNLRSAAPPQFESAPAASVQIVDRGAATARGSATPSSTRRWQYLLFPRRSGAMTVPAVVAPVFSPARHERETMRCAAVTLNVSTAQPDESTVPRSSGRTSPSFWPIAAGIAALGIAVIVAKIVRRQATLSRTVRGIVGDSTPATVREAVNLRLAESGISPAALLRESTDRGDAYRSLQSLLDGLETERIHVEDPAGEIRRRVRELLVA